MTRAILAILAVAMLTVSGAASGVTSSRDAGSDALGTDAMRTARIREMAVEVLVSGQPESPRSSDRVRKGAETAGVPTLPAPTGGIGTALVAGYASWYDDGPGHYAAAGPALRIGHWRGRVITVRSGERFTVVRLTDACWCGERAGLPTLLDLSPDAFADLAPLAAGVVAVEIELGGPALPNTDTEEDAP